ncbi:MAG: isoprenylcysteine carboxylmethyltransferase family protein [Thermodesulfobacteriota bacterium]|nr:isoprenylcysteine carboxylmethyltransferase family protein [Thermodesulfobacteriota bacterium]
MESLFQSVNDLFNNKKTRKILVKLRLPIALIFIVAVIFQIKKEFFFWGLSISFTGEFIQLWCFAALDKQQTIARRGLYAITRNPMYLGRYFIILGGIVLTGNIWLISVYTLFYYFYMVNRVKREEKTLKKVFGQEYSTYCQQVNRFFPFFASSPGRGSSLKSLYFFKWKLFFQNHGHWNLLSVIVVYCIIAYSVFW